MRGRPSWLRGVARATTSPSAHLDLSYPVAMRYATAMSLRQNLWRWPLAGVDLVFDRLLAVVGALAASQLPGYMHHYMQPRTQISVFKVVGRGWSWV